MKMEVASEGDRNNEPAALDVPIRVWVPSSSLEPHFHHQKAHIQSLL
jgi:hypothetical protein